MKVLIVPHSRKIEEVRWVREDPSRENWFWPTEEMKQIAWMSDEKIYEDADKDPVGFWAKLAREGIEWYKEFDGKIYDWKSYTLRWFEGGKLNACYNAVDRHIRTWKRTKAAIIWEPEPVGEDPRVLTYLDLYREVNRFASALKSIGIKKGDRVGIYLPMIPEVHIAALACARIGAIHSIVFSAFSPEALRDRILDAGAKALITADGYYRRGKVVNLKENADAAVEGTNVEKIVVARRVGMDVGMVKGRDYWWDELVDDADKHCEPEIMESEDTLFILYTSGTTGKPKGVIHETGGYITQAYWTTKWIFDVHDEDVFWCTSDIGWVTGHTYGCYGPLLLGATMLVYEGAPDYPDPGRVWSIIEKYGVTIFYTAPTLIRMLAKLGDEWPKKYDLRTIRLLGSVGEPIDANTWLWYFRTAGGGRCPIVDTWWQTETGGVLISSLPGIGPFVPTVAGRSFPGTRHVVMDEDGKPAEEGYLMQTEPFAPGMLRGLWNARETFIENYWRFGEKYYVTGDGAKIIDHGIFRLLGRVDDVIKVAGHRMSTAEMEDAIRKHPAVAEVAVTGMPHEVKGESPIAFVVLKEGAAPPDPKELVKLCEKFIGPIARPERIIFVDDLPKTRSGKIMRRLLKKMVRGEPLGDTTTLMNPESLNSIASKLKSE